AHESALTNWLLWSVSVSLMGVKTQQSRPLFNAASCPMNRSTPSCVDGWVGYRGKCPPGCRLCAPNWLLHGDKCYWLSKESKKWNESREDCSAKSSQMLMSQDQREMVKSIAGCGNFSWRVVEFDLSKRSALLTPTPPIAGLFPDWSSLGIGANSRRAPVLEHPQRKIGGCSAPSGSQAFPPTPAYLHLCP
uniref:C-type lectin domain-containing protein n=1 Tax=Gopherus evgoodei TaxID=1825980 RepID=A0A8C4W2E3_9SAUR